MRPLLHPVLVNGRTGDPALYIETLFEKRAILIDLGDISRLPPRKIQRLEGVFVSHAHIDHFIGFDHLLRVMAGRQKTIAFYGPRGFIDQVYHKLQAYRWNLVDQFASDWPKSAASTLPSMPASSARMSICSGASEGLATVFRGAVDYAKLARTLRLPDQQFVTFAQTVGYVRG